MIQSILLRTASALVCTLLMVDIAFTTDTERLYSSLHGFCNAVELQTAKPVASQLADDFTFEYNASLVLHRDEFLVKFESFMENGPALLLKEYSLQKGDHVAVADATYTLQDRTPSLMRPARSEGIDARCRLTWNQNGDKWELSRIELLTLDGKTPRLSYLGAE